MTLAPLVHESVRGVEGKARLLPPGSWCVAPGCLSLAQQRHHVWPRSYLRGQPYEWVEVHGKTICNSVGLCLQHHSWVTGGVGGHLAKIVWDGDLELLTWWEMDDSMQEWFFVGPLRRQDFVQKLPEAAHVRREEGLCPTCGRLKAKAKVNAPKRKVKSYSIAVPDDAEVGTDVLDTYIEDLAVLMGFDTESPRLMRYHVLVPVLEWVMQAKVEFIREWEEAAAA